MNEVFDDHWVARFKDGDAQAFRELYDHFYKQLYFFTQKITGETGEAEDIVIETFTKLFKRPADFDSYVNIRAFLYITARNACFNMLKAAELQSKKRKEITLLSETVAYNDVNRMEEQMLEGEVLEAIYKAVEKLPSECQKVFKLIYFHGMKQDAIAKQLGISKSTVRNHRTRAIKLLRSNLPPRHRLLLVWVLSSGILQYLHKNNFPG